DVFVHVKSGLTNHNFTVPTNPVIMRKAGCVYTDYVIGVQTGQTITVRSTDPVLCNVHMTPTNRANAEWNKAMVPGSRGPTSVAKPPSRINLLWNKWSARIAKLLGRPAAQLPPPVSELGFQIANAELPVRLKCDVHPWEFAYIFCVDHPFFAVTDTNGMFHFPQPLPPGKYVLEAIHRKAGRLTKEIEITDGRGARVDFEFEVK
ncbi:MAG: carboxypeptidase regulatory-like domain-containing protein, partial [Verrucomicrobia bacterium]|nr:carboxypeptidase regulatory-like domain-containing protein [Verrucomicrobiota bacterium]